MRVLAVVLVAACGDQRALPDARSPVDAPDPLDADAAALDAPPIPPDRADVQSITVATTELLAGERSTATVTLSKPAPADGQAIEITVGDETVLAAPSAVFVESGATAISFDVFAKRPARPTALIATGGATSRSVAIRVGGLAIAELFTDPAGPDGSLEWIKLSNATGVAIELAAYTIGHGRTHYTYSRIQLVGLIPPHACFLVGGPISSPLNGSPTYSQTFNISPNLLTGSNESGQATGTALFDLPITQLDQEAIPIDTVLCGRSNLAGLVGTDGMPAAVGCPDIASGHSVARTAPAVWSDLAAPTPHVCTPF
jgi:hypothetical protein